MVLKIDGIDLIPYVAHGGFKWQRSDVDGTDAGRDLAGDLHRNRVATKRRLDVTCRPLTNAEIKTVLSLIMPEWVTVEYYDPQVGAVVSKRMYSNNNPASYLFAQPDGMEVWGGVTFPLIEK